MRRIRQAGVAAALVPLLAACLPEPPASPATVAPLPMKALMEHVIDPAADVFWGASGTIITAAGEKSRAPTTPEGWAAAVGAAATLVEGSTLLSLPGRAREGEWRRYAAELGAAATEGMKAAEAKDEKAVFDSGGRIYLACRACHMKYVPGYK